MFEGTENREDKGRTRIILAVSVVGVLLIVGVIVFLGARQPPAPVVEGPKPLPSLPGAKHAGDPEFDKNIGLVALTEQKFFTQANMLGQLQALMTGNVRNFNDKPVVGIEIKATVLDQNGKVVAQTIAMPVPKQYAQVPARGNIPYSVTVDGVPNNGTLDDMKIEVVGLIMGE